MSSTPPSTPPSPTTNTNPLSDIFSDSPPPSPHLNNEPSDLPRLRSTHITAGYRTGISISKTPALQPGFDEGYSLGAVFGLRIGSLLGMLEGLYACACSSSLDKNVGEGDEEKREKERVGKLLRKAREELSVERVFGREWWDGNGDGGWRYDVLVGKGEEVTWMEVVGQHPVVRKWEGVVREEVERGGVRRGVFEGEGWEGGRVMD